MKEVEQQRQLQQDLETIMLRYSEEYDISFASVLGVLQVVTMNIFNNQPMEE